MHIFILIPVSSQPCQRSSRIVGGEDAVKGETPYIVSLTRRGAHFCGATILNERWILTAGHCVCNGINKVMKPNQIRGNLGQHQISLSENVYEVTFDEIITHPNYNCDKVENDIALLKLHKTIDFSDHVSPICVASPSNPHQLSGTKATVSGWGWMNEDQSTGLRADTLQKASVEIWRNDVCEDSYRSLKKPHKISNLQLCAGYKAGGIDSCWADSGGPLVNRDNILIGVVSTGIGCARAGLPGIYTRVSEYGSWIRSTINT